ncbi:MAG: D-alanyl-D-alanine carboxypeptidase [Gammaproteobacteria bacterium]|nr:D-alanyl-D-alanine carboxypeptidase [Gammaproteobacteria bacterium]
MKKVVTLFWLVCFLMASSVSAAIAPVPAPPALAANSYILMDFNSGRILASKDVDKKIEPASITKIMTAYVVYKEIEAGRLSMQSQVTVSKKAWQMGGSKMFIEVGKQVSVDDLLKGLVIQSGNDAAIALAEHIGGSEDVFASLMNQYAAKLGMNNTYFVNSTGWPDSRHLTTARDIATLARATIAEFPDHYRLYAEHEFTWNNITQPNRNLLLYRDNTVDGIKTGHTDSAGYCLVSSAVRDNMRLISVVTGTKSDAARADISQALLGYGYRFYESDQMYVAGEGLNKTRVWKGREENLSIGLEDDLHITVPRGQYKKLNTVMEVAPDIEAPVQKGQQLGMVRVMLDGEEILSRPLVALQTVAEGSLWQRARDNIIRFFQ